MVIAACVKVFLAHGRLNTHKQSNCRRGTCLASAPGRRRRKTGPGRHQDNGRCVQSALTSRTLRDTAPARKHSRLRGEASTVCTQRWPPWHCPCILWLSARPLKPAFLLPSPPLAHSRTKPFLEPAIMRHVFMDQSAPWKKKKVWVLPALFLSWLDTEPCLINARSMEVCEHFLDPVCLKADVGI